jgi:hypothetical protein
MALGDRLISLRARIGAVKDRFELATSTHCILLPEGADPVIVSPNPNIHTIDSRMVERWLAPEVQVEGDEQVLSGLSRMYSREQLTGADILIDATETAGGYSGKLARILAISDKSPVVWGLIIKVIEPDHFYPFVPVTLFPTALWASIL